MVGMEKNNPYDDQNKGAPSDELTEILEKSFTEESERLGGKTEPGRISAITKAIAAKFREFTANAADLLKDDSKIEPILLKVDEKFQSVPKDGDKLRYIPDMILLVRSYILKQYTDIAFEHILMILAGLLYFLSPVDVLPDAIPLVGLIDDIAVIAFLITACQEDLDRYMLWLKSKNMAQ